MLGAEFYQTQNSFRAASFAGVLICVAGTAWAGNIDGTDKYAWGTNVGWNNFNPTHGGGVTVYDDHLEGYVWAENIGWIKLNGSSGGGSPYYANTTNSNYGVNNDGSGTLSGYGWSKNVGWVNFKPSDGGVTIGTGCSFDGYAWAENVGWIHFKKSDIAIQCCHHMERRNSVSRWNTCRPDRPELPR